MAGHVHYVPRGPEREAMVATVMGEYIVSYDYSHGTQMSGECWPCACLSTVHTAPSWETDDLVPHLYTGRNWKGTGGEAYCRSS